MGYSEEIKKARLVEDVETTTSTGDMEYEGTALEVYDKQGEELFHIVVDDKGNKQLLFFEIKDRYRISLELMEQILIKAKEVVKNEDEL